MENSKPGWGASQQISLCSQRSTQFHILSSLLRGAQVMISSTLRIISAASVAESSTACLTLNASEMPSSTISPICNDLKDARNQQTGPTE